MAQQVATRDRVDRMSHAASDAMDTFHWMLSFACWEPTDGHHWKPSDVLSGWSGPETVGGRPGCPKCRRIWHSKMSERGVGEGLQRFMFDKIGAKWLWNPPKDDAPVRPRREVWIMPDRRLGDRVQFHSDDLTEQHRQENRELESERDRLIAIRAEAIDQGMDLLEAIQTWPLPDSGKHVHNIIE